MEVEIARDSSIRPRQRTATELVRELRARNAQSREPVLRSIARLREIAEAKRRRR